MWALLMHPLVGHCCPSSYFHLSWAACRPTFPYEAEAEEAQQVGARAAEQRQAGQPAQQVQRHKEDRRSLGGGLSLGQPRSKELWGRVEGRGDAGQW